MNRLVWRRLGRFDLVRLYALVSLLSIALVSVVSAVLLTRFVVGHLLERDAVVSMQFIQSFTRVDDPSPFFGGSDQPRHRSQSEAFFRHIIELPNVLRANVYRSDGTIVWSSNEKMIGKSYSVNPQLDAALAGSLVFHHEDRHESDKDEHADLPVDVSEFVESYVPIWDHEGQAVVGAVELYKAPTALIDAMRHGVRLVIAIALGSGLFLFTTLFWLVRRANLVIREQEERLGEAQTLATVGKMSFAVAHSIRNPLAAIRSSAEITEESQSLRGAQQAARDIMAEVDRLGEWVKELLLLSRFDGDHNGSVALNEVLAEVIAGFGDAMTKQNITLKQTLQADLPPVRGDRSVISQIFKSLLSNAIDAMSECGELTIAASGTRRRVEVTIGDSGVGIPASRLPQLLELFVTDKVDGLGLGLPLARRLIRRLGGDMSLESVESEGTTVRLHFPVGVQ